MTDYTGPDPDYALMADKLWKLERRVSHIARMLGEHNLGGTLREHERVVRFSTWRWHGQDYDSIVYMILGQDRYDLTLSQLFMQGEHGMVDGSFPVACLTMPDDEIIPYVERLNAASDADFKRNRLLAIQQNIAMEQAKIGAASNRILVLENERRNLTR